MFEVSNNGKTVKMHAGDTGSFAVKAIRSSGEDWTIFDILCSDNGKNKDLR